MDDIEFYFKLQGNTNRNVGRNFQDGITSLSNPLDSESCFSYNCNYANCQYYNMYYNKKKFKNGKDYKQITNDDYSNINLEYINEYIEGDPDEGTIYELEGGRGRKASIIVKNNELGTNNNLSIKINNPGYLYQVGDLLRIKDKDLKNVLFFSVTETNSASSSIISETKFTQEYIKAHHGKSNTVKYSLDTENCLLLKELNISGSTNSKVLVRLIEICKPLKNVSNTNLSGINTDKNIQEY